MPENLGNGVFSADTEEKRQRIKIQERFFLQRNALRVRLFDKEDPFFEKNYLPEVFVHTGASRRFFEPTHYMDVHYFSPAEKERCRIFISDGKICKLTRNEIIDRLCLDTIETDVSDTVMVILNRRGEIFSCEKKKELQHTSFEHAAPLLFSGYWKVHAGKITEIISYSGHYNTSIHQLINFIRFLNDRGAGDLTDVVCIQQVRLKPGMSDDCFRKEIYSAQELLHQETPAEFFTSRAGVS